MDEAIRRRLLLVPCNVTIPRDQRDPKLVVKLAAEHPQILAWAVEGYQQWQRIGLKPPAAVLDATTEYLAHQDDLQLWINERTKPLGYGSTPGKELFRDWADWKKGRAEHPGTQRAFNDKLLDKGYPRKQTMNGVTFQNIQLINPLPPQGGP